MTFTKNTYYGKLMRKTSLSIVFSIVIQQVQWSWLKEITLAVLHNAGEFELQAPIKI